MEVAIFISFYRFYFYRLFLSTYQKIVIEKKKVNQIPVCQHGRTDNSQTVLGDRLLGQSWYQVDSFHSCPVKKNLMTQYVLSSIAKLFTRESFRNKNSPSK